MTKHNFTAVLLCCGDGSKFSPMVIFKKPSQESNEKRWMNQQMMNFWLTKWYTKCPDGFFRTRKAQLVMDSMWVHITTQFKKWKVFNSIPAIINGGLTKVLQALDILVNRSFKTDWEHSFTATGRMRHATFRASCKSLDGSRKLGLQWQPKPSCRDSERPE